MTKIKAAKVLTKAEFSECRIKQGARILICAETNIVNGIRTIETSLILRDKTGEVVIGTANKERGWLFEVGTCCSRVVKEISQDDSLMIERHGKSATAYIAARLTQSVGTRSRHEFPFGGSYHINSHNFERFFLIEEFEDDYDDDDEF